MSRNPTRRSDPVYALQSAEPQAGARSAFAPGESATFSMDALKSTDKGGTSTVPLNNADTRKTAPPNRAVPRANDPVACAEVGDMSNDEIIFVTEAVRLAQGPHPFSAVRMLARSIVLLQRHAHEPQDIDPRVQMVLERLGYAPAPIVAGPVADVITITGVDLPNPAPIAVSDVAPPTHAAVLRAVDWLKARASLQPVRTGEFEAVAKIMEGMGVEIRRQAAEISELQDMLEEATPVARFVADLAAMSDAECALNGSLVKVRDQARSKCDFPWPKFYSEEDRNRAIDALEAAIAANAQPSGGTRRFYQGATVDVIAEALGLTKAGQ